jgi:hypothetical protein
MAGSVRWLYQNRSSRDSRLSPAEERPAGVQNPCPKSPSHNHRCQKVVRRSAWRGSGWLF